MSLYLKYRPKSLERMRGNTDILSTLDAMLAEKENCPHAFLLHGPTGCGKTTIARIIANRLNCSGVDLREIDSADFRGIDTIRTIRKDSSFMPIESDCRVWIIDECFAKDTQIHLVNGEQKPIQEIKVGEYVQNLYGKGKVLNIFENRVPLNRMVALSFEKGERIVCSIDHLFLTPNGWVPAKELLNNFVFLKISCNFTDDINSLTNEKNEKNERCLSTLWQKIKEGTSKILFSKMFHTFNSKACNNASTRLSSVWRAIYRSFLFPCRYMWEKMWKRIRRKEKDGGKEILNHKKEIVRSKEEIISNGERNGVKKSHCQKDDVEKSGVQSNDNLENKGNETNQWNTTRLVGGKRGQWKIDTPTNNISNGIRLGNGVSNKNRAFPFGWLRISSKLQGRFRKSKIENSNRSGWSRASVERRQIKRLEKGYKVERIRVESVTLYERGGDQSHFYGIVTDQERDQGFIKFYDLEVEGHPSYIANGFLVHNCHKMTNDAQNALLKILEDTPHLVYFVLCTTEPQKLLPTIKGRCSQFQVKPLDEDEMYQLLRKVVKREGQTLEREIYDIIIQDSMGHPRNALQILEQVLHVDSEKREQVARQTAAEQSQAIELCRLLLNPKTSWPQVNKVLVGLKEQDAESIRRIVLGYCQAVLLKSDLVRAGRVMEEFISPFYDSGFPQLVYACYAIIKNG